MADIFLSYSREDKAKADQVAAALGAGGYDVFWDKEIPPGQSWADYLEGRLNECKALIVLWSASSTASQWVKEEARLARDKGKLIPAMLDASPPPFGFGEVQAANLTDWSGDLEHYDWKRLVAAVDAAVRRGGGAPGAPRPYTPPPPPPAPRPVMAAPTFTPPPSAPPHFSAQYQPAPAAARRGLPAWVWGITGAFALLVALFVIGLIVGGEDTDDKSAERDRAASESAYASAEPSDEAPPPRDIPEDVRDIVEQARQVGREGLAAAQRARQNAAAGAQAYAAAQAGQAGYSIQPMPQGAIAGNITQLQSGQETPVALQAQNGMAFQGTFQGRSDGGYTMDGVVTWGSVGAEGRWTYTPSGYDYIGAAAIPGRFNLVARERGVLNGSDGRGLGIVTYPDGRRYEGEYRTAGEGPQAQVFRNGRGVLYGANGDVQEAGRFNNDRFVSGR